MFELLETSVSASNRKALDRLLSPTGGRKYVLGRNKYAASVACMTQKWRHLSMILLTKQRDWDARIIRMCSLPEDCLVVSCVVDGRPLTALDRLRSRNVNTVVDYTRCLGWPPICSHH